MDQASEAQLISNLMKGDRASLGELLGQYQHRLFNIVLRMVGNRDDAVDVMGQVMANIVQGISCYRGPASLSTWMIRVAMNAAISHRQKQPVRHTISLDGLEVTSQVDMPSSFREQLTSEWEPAPDPSVQQRELLSLLQIAISRLAEEFQPVLVLRDIDGMDYEQIAQVLAVSIGVVKSRLFRARLALRREMLQLRCLCKQAAGPETVA